MFLDEMPAEYEEIAWRKVSIQAYMDRDRWVDRWIYSFHSVGFLTQLCYHHYHFSHPRYHRIQHTLASLYIKAGNMDRAEELLLALLAAQSSDGGANSIDTLRIQLLLAQVHATKGKHNEAMAMLVQCIDKGMQDHPFIYLFVYRNIHPFIHLTVYPSMDASIQLTIHPYNFPFYLSIDPSHPSIHSSITLSIYLCRDISVGRQTSGRTGCHEQPRWVSDQCYYQ